METVRSLTMDDIPEARALWESCFHDSPSFLDWFFSKRYRPETSLCLLRNGQIASLAHGCPMTLAIRGKRIPGLMVSGVSTRPEYRGMGDMHRVFRSLFALARENGIPLLFNTPAAPHTYDSLGFRPCSDALYWVAAENAPVEAPVFDPFPPLSDLTECYGAATKRYSVSVLREQTDMERKLGDYQSDGGRCLTHWENGALTGYCIVLPGEQGGYTLPEALALTNAAYRALLTRLPRGSTAKLPSDLPFPGERRPQCVMAAADVPALLSALCGDEALTFAVTDPVTPQNSGVFNGLGQPSCKAADYTLSPGQLLQLLSGYGPGDTHFPARSCYCIDEY